MKHALNKVNLGDSHISENLKSPNYDDKGLRSERRRRRREVRNDSLKNNHVSSAKRTTTKICGNTSVSIVMIDDEIDEDWANFLATYTGDDDDDEAFLATYNADSASNQSRDNEVDPDYGASLANYTSDIGGSNIGVDVGNSNDSDEVDPDYALLLNTVTIVDDDEEYMRVKNTTNTSVREDGKNSSNIGSASNHTGGSNIGTGVGNSNDSDEVDEDYALFLNDVTIVDDDETYMRVKNTTNTSIREDRSNPSNIDSASNHSGGSNIGVGNSNDSDEVDPDYALFLDSVTIVDGDEEYMRVKNTTNTSIREDRNTPSKIDSASNHNGGSNIGVDVGNNNDSVKVDPNYALFLNPVTIVDGDETYMPVKNTTNTSKVENRSNSSDSDLIVLESYPICGNTPFVPSKMYDSSWFGGEKNPKDNMQIPTYDDSHFRRRLLECLDRPYDHREYKELINRLCIRNQTECDSEGAEGVTTPYHETYPDIAKAIAEVHKERPKVLFLLRGFFFWLENVCHMGSFQPWHDEQCMELLRKMKI